MGKKKAGSGGWSAGTKIQVKPNVHHPEFPAIDIGGWTGAVSETIGKGAEMRLVIDWSPETVARMPEGFADQCEAMQLLYTMACLGCGEVEIVPC